MENINNQQQNTINEIVKTVPESARERVAKKLREYFTRVPQVPPTLGVL